MKLQVGVKVLIKKHSGAYLFLRRSREKYQDMAPQWDIPGGRIESEEPLIEALKREVNEETGLDIVGTPRLLAAQDIFVEQKDLHVVRLTYEAEASGELTLSDEHYEYAWMSREQALVDSSLDRYIRDILTA